MIMSPCGNSSWLRAQQTQRKHQLGCSPIQLILVELGGWLFVYDSQGGRGGNSNPDKYYTDITYPVAAKPLFLGYSDIDYVHTLDFKVQNRSATFLVEYWSNTSIRLAFSDTSFGSLSWWGIFIQ